MQEKDFFSLFKIGDYIYPGAYARNMLIFTNQAMKRLDELVEEGYTTVNIL